MSEMCVRTLARFSSTKRRRSAPPPPDGHERRILTLRDRYAELGLCGNQGDPRDGKPRRVRVGGRLYPSAAAAERAIGASRGAVCVAIARGQRCQGLKVEWVE